MIYKRFLHSRHPLLKRKAIKLSGSELDTITVPPQYPQLIPVPLTKRPLFPGFYKSMYVKDPNLIAALQEMIDKNKPYVGIFLNKQDTDSDIITNTNQIYKTGVFAQITNTSSTGSEGLTFVVYPHRRIRINDDRLFSTNEFAKMHNLEPNAGNSKIFKGLDGINAINAPLLSLNTCFVNVENIMDEPCNPENRVIKALTAEIVAVLKEITKLSPLLRDQIVAASIQFGNIAGNI